MIVQSISRGTGRASRLTLPQGDLRRAVEPARELTEALGSPPPTHCPNVAKVSVFGVGMRSHTGVAARMFQALARGHQHRDDQHQRSGCVNVVVDDRRGG